MARAERAANIPELGARGNYVQEAAGAKLDHIEYRMSLIAQSQIVALVLDT